MSNKENINSKTFEKQPERTVSSSDDIAQIIGILNNKISKNESTEFVEQIKKADEMLDDSSLSHSEIHPEAVYVSRLFDPLNIRAANMQSNHSGHSDNRDEEKSIESLIITDSFGVVTDFIVKAKDSALDDN
ncbi:20070_t:CDS:2 [Dentiscutata erythropus]|uniref:20070_t:CDS:1 n=1 Tax=Dentiscutata erythropus TaxID=1348616 RepID=A0A9N8VQF5_9GLOM|nr:20070_t:CDS:2 [Dentiscutata erythropus]